MTARYVVTEIEGWSTLRDRRSARARPGLSVQVLDRAVCHRIVWQARTEDYGIATDRARDWLRYEAARECARRNGEPEPEPFNRWRSRFRPTCPGCGAKCDPNAAYCSCGKNLYRREARH